MKRDLAEMEHMIDEYLAFARGEGGEAVETVGVRALIEEVGEGARRAGAEVEVDGRRGPRRRGAAQRPQARARPTW